MCKCTSEIRTPWCGAVGCEAPIQLAKTPEEMKEQLREQTWRLALTIIDELEELKKLSSNFRYYGDFYSDVDSIKHLFISSYVRRHREHNETGKLYE